jgi:hypothetical protein
MDLVDPVGADHQPVDGRRPPAVRGEDVADAVDVAFVGHPLGLGDEGGGAFGERSGSWGHQDPPG